MKYLFFLFCLSANIALLQCTPKTEAVASTTSKVETKAVQFLQDWLGQWKGELDIYKEGDKKQTLPMQLHIQPISNSAHYTWTIIYGEDTQEGARNYELHTIDASKGQYLIDEKNSIKIEGYFFDNKFISWYSVMESQMVITYEKQGEQLIFEVMAGNQNPVSTTGNTGEGEQQIPEVKTYPVPTFQRAVLTR